MAISASDCCNHGIPWNKACQWCEEEDELEESIYQGMVDDIIYCSQFDTREEERGER